MLPKQRGVERGGHEGCMGGGGANMQRGGGGGCGRGGGVGGYPITPGIAVAAGLPPGV